MLMTATNADDARESRDRSGSMMKTRLTTADAVDVFLFLNG